METAHGRIEGDLVVTGALAFHGLTTNSITVESGGILHLYGTCANNLIVKAGGLVIVQGIVGHDIHNAGKVKVEGIVEGSVLSLDGEFVKSPSGVVRGRTIVRPV